MKKIFNALGGEERLISWINESSSNYKDFLKIWFRLYPVQPEAPHPSEIKVVIAEEAKGL